MTKEEAEAFCVLFGLEAQVVQVGPEYAVALTDQGCYTDVREAVQELAEEHDLFEGLRPDAAVPVW
jgi:hypothetical protein